MNRTLPALKSHFVLRTSFEIAKNLSEHAISLRLDALLAPSVKIHIIPIFVMTAAWSTFSILHQGCFWNQVKYDSRKCSNSIILVEATTSNFSGTIVEIPCQPSVYIVTRPKLWAINMELNNVNNGIF